MEQPSNVFKVVNVVSQLLAVIRLNMTLITPPLAFVLCAQADSKCFGVTGNLPEVDSYGRLIPSLDSYVMSVLRSNK